MKKVTRYIVFSMLLMLILSGCSSNASLKEDIFQYKGSYVGDNSAVGNIVNSLPHNKELKQISLQTKKEPYGVTLDYKGINSTMVEKELKETAIFNSTFIFALIKNADWITFRFPDHEYTVTKENLQKWYGKKFDGITNEKDLKKFINDHLKNEREVNQLFKD